MSSEERAKPTHWSQHRGAVLVDELDDGDSGGWVESIEEAADRLFDRGLEFPARCYSARELGPPKINARRELEEAYERTCEEQTPELWADSIVEHVLDGYHERDYENADVQDLQKRLDAWRKTQPNCSAIEVLNVAALQAVFDAWLSDQQFCTVECDQPIDLSGLEEFAREREAEQRRALGRWRREEMVVERAGCEDNDTAPVAGVHGGAP